MADRTLASNEIAARIDAIDYSDFAVKAEHIDANGHMNVGYYGVVFDKALDRPWNILGIYSQLSLQQGLSSFALESHFTYQRELKLGDPLSFELQMLDYDAKRVHYFLRMLHARERFLAATCEQISMCMNMNERRSTSWSAQALENIAELHAAHASRTKPTEVGSVIGIRRK